ncbi:MAG: SCP2 sterol-binding domain-containing protein [Asgard group archaeon]|nr:SCP2 sterol-binding domain-containing protein [Asgard group archaeon]
MSGSLMDNDNKKTGGKENMTSKEEIIEEMNKFREKMMQEKYAKHFQGWNKTMQYYFTDRDEKYYIELVNGKPKEPKEGEIEKPEISYKMSTDTFLSLMNGEISGMKAYTSGKLKVKASMPDLMKLQKLN